MTHKVIQFSTGNVGQHALRQIIEHPDLELVGVHASSPTKVGRDAAELCGLAVPTGVTATDDVQALAALGADCVVYTSQGETRPNDALVSFADLGGIATLDVADGNEARQQPALRVLYREITLMVL